MNDRISYDLEINKEEVGRRIKDIRLSMGLTLEDFGERIGGVSKGGVYHWENGKNLPNRKRLKKIAKIKGISLDELLYGESIWEKFNDKYNKDGNLSKNIDKLDGMINYLETLGFIVNHKIIPLSSHKEDMIDDEGVKVGEADVVNDATIEVTISDGENIELVYSGEEFEEFQNDIEKLIKDYMEEVN